MKEKVTNKVKQQFSKNAEKYVKSKSHSNKDRLAVLTDWLNPQEDWVVLDIATGGGHVAHTIAPHVNTVFATDITEEMLEKASSYLQSNHQNIWYTIADAESLPFLENTFDAVTCRIAPHHFPNPDCFIQQVYKVLKPGGKFLLIDNVVPSDNMLAEYMNTFEKLRDESHVRCLSLNEWYQLFESVGLLEVKNDVRKKKYNYPSWVRRMAKDESQVQRVSEFILKGSKEVREYYSVFIENDQIQSLEVDEWIVMCKKV